MKTREEIIASIKYGDTTQKEWRDIIEKRLPDVPTFLTCEDFKHLDFECCPDCHSIDIYDMSVLLISEYMDHPEKPRQHYAWVCDHLLWHLLPHTSPQYREANGRLTPEERTLREIFGENI